MTAALMIFAFGYIVLWRAGSRWERIRDGQRHIYTLDLIPIVYTGAIGVAPLMGLGLIILGVAVALPRPLAVWVVLPGLMIMCLALLLTYRVPQPWLPGWLRDEIDRGTTRAPRPIAMDWLIFGILVFVTVGSVIGWIYGIATGMIDPGA